MHAAQLRDNQNDDDDDDNDDDGVNHYDHNNDDHDDGVDYYDHNNDNDDGGNHGIIITITSVKMIIFSFYRQGLIDSCTLVVSLHS